MTREERERERISIAALHAAGRRCGRANCPGCPPEIDFDALPGAIQEGQS